MPKTAALLALSISLAAAQSATQVKPNVTICNWGGLRAGIIQDTIYLDGGNLWWQSATGGDGEPVLSNNGGVDGLMFTMNLSYAFDTTTFNKTTSLLQPLSKTGGTAGNNIAPNYIDGAMFVNDGELYLYGGLLRLTDAFTAPDPDAVLGYEAYQYGPPRTTWSRGFITSKLPGGVTRYISNGAAVSAPSENLGFYFSGLRGVGWGQTTQTTSDWYPANTLIQVDMTTMRSEQWSNSTLPPNITARAGAELVWLPVGSGQGTLVAIGGITAVEDLLPAGLNVSQSDEAKQEAPGFMTSLPIYDIVTKIWYLQNTTGDGPGQLTEFCTVVAQAKDSSSFNIYVYGGYDGLNSTSIPSDDVWILSIPSFTWFKAYSGVSSHGRRGHKCERVYPDQMFVIGGVNPNPERCIDGGPVQVFNLNTLKFQKLYDPREWSEYSVPDIVTAVIGGTGQGGSTKAANISNSNLASLFKTAYVKPRKTYYPYAPASGPSGSTPTPTPVPANNGLAKWVAPVLGVVLGLVALSIIAVVILLFRRRKNLRRKSITGSSVSGRSGSNNRILNWVNGMPHTSNSDKNPDPSVTSTEGETETYVHSPLVGFQEVAGSERYEVGNNEKERPPAEMATPFHFQDHPNYPRNIDFAYGPGTASEGPGSNSDPSQRGVSDAHIHDRAPINSPASAVSPQLPYVRPQSLDNLGASPTSSPTRTSGAISPQLGSHGNSPSTFAAGQIGSDVGKMGDGKAIRPMHQRNVSSLSDNLYQLPSPEIVLTPDGEENDGDDRQRREYIGDVAKRLGALDRGEDGGEEKEEVGGNQRVGGGSGSVARKATQPGKKSSFGELLDEGDETHRGKK